MSNTGYSATAGARLAGAFSPTVYKKLAAEMPSTPSSSFSRVLAISMGQSLTTGQAFDAAYREMQRSYQNEYVYKNTIISKIIFGRHSPRTTSALLELAIGKSCADVVVLNGTMTTYEVKSDLDNLSRLSTQLRDYCTRTEHVNVVVSELKAPSVAQALPDHIGLIALRRNGSLATLRPSLSNRSRLDADHLFLLLRTAEAQRVARRLGTPAFDGPVGYAWPRLRASFSQLDPWLLHAEVLVELRRRRERAGELAQHADFPQSLRALAYGTELSASGSTRLLRRLSEPARVL